MPKRLALDVEQMTPFARMIYDYMLASRPTKLVIDLAEETGISNQTIWDWLRKGVIPRRGTVVQLAERIPDLPLNDLLHAAGFLSAEETLATRRRNKRALKTIARQYEAALDQLTRDNPAFSPEQREMLLHWAREELPAMILRGDDLTDLLASMSASAPSEPSADDETAEADAATETAENRQSRRSPVPNGSHH